MCHVLFAIDATAVRVMPTMHVDHAVFRQMSQPQMKRHRAVLNKVIQSSVSFEQDILHDITGIHSPSDGSV